MDKVSRYLEDMADLNVSRGLDRRSGVYLGEAVDYLRFAKTLTGDSSYNGRIKEVKDMKKVFE